MTIFKALLSEVRLPCVISFIGGGGKTTAMFRLAYELKSLGRHVLVTTTTAIFKPDHGRYDTLRILAGGIDAVIKPPARNIGSVTVIASGYRMQKDKLDGLNREAIDTFAEKKDFDVILVEADGSRRLPLKAPAEHEPVVPESTGICVGVTGFECYGRPADTSTVHRLDEFLGITGKAAGALIDQEMLLSLVDSPRGMFKGTPAAAGKIWLINKVDTEVQLSKAADLGSYVLKESSVPDKVLLASVQQEDPIRKVL